MSVRPAIRQSFATPTTISMPKAAPQIWARMYDIPLINPICPVNTVVSVTAGLRCPPEIFAVIKTA